VINLGLDLSEALDLDLQTEISRELGGMHDHQLPVAEYVPERCKDSGQTQRVELNAVTSPEFIHWLDSKFEAYTDKMLPPHRVLREELDTKTRLELERRVAADILSAGSFASRVGKAMADARESIEALDLDRIVRTGPGDAPEQRWDRPLGSAAADLAEKVLNS
jgi:hypothetical protein